MFSVLTVIDRLTPELSLPSVLAPYLHRLAVALLVVAFVVFFRFFRSALMMLPICVPNVAVN